ncbi:LAME_0E08064g1_1 [Lachancea meyersii CBS 8951]|uniref:LAME_0E08064g1_1 n=1 Tax=Lachancea meyersii CBS 8951 TaxID=1266667 RepID=A0A1G4JJ37_9SACH|nr:LAME_0E08064g1_1 [Lachancea meyersii CBS 8951]
MSEILSFKAGVATFDENSKICSPTPIKGEIIVKHSEEAEGFFDFQWKPIEKVASGNVDPIEFILIPGSTKWTHIKSCKSGRVFCLVFSSDEKHFFWLQDKNQNSEQLNELSEADKAIEQKLTELLRSNDEEEAQEEQDHKMQTEDQTEDQDVDMDLAPTSNQPIAHISDFLLKQLLIDYVESLDPQSPQLRRLLEHLPADQRRDKAALVECLRGPFYYQATDSLSRSLLEGFEASLAISNGFGYQFSGDGVLGFLKGARAKAKEEEQKQDQNHSRQDEN